jgi:hypothetical protein
LWFDLPAFCHQSRTRGALIVTHDDPRVRAADEVAAILKVFVHTFEFMTSSSIQNGVCYPLASASDHMIQNVSSDLNEVKRKVKIPYQPSN